MHSQLVLPANWDALVVTLPVQVCRALPQYDADGRQDTPLCMDELQGGSLAMQLDFHMERFKLVLSQVQVVFLRTYRLETGGIHNVTSFNKQFFCAE